MPGLKPCISVLRFRTRHFGESGFCSQAPLSGPGISEICSREIASVHSASPSDFPSSPGNSMKSAWVEQGIGHLCLQPEAGTRLSGRPWQGNAKEAILHSACATRQGCSRRSEVEPDNPIVEQLHLPRTENALTAVDPRSDDRFH